MLELDALRFNNLIEFSVMLKKKLINGEEIKNITMDTSDVLVQTCNGLVELNIC